MSSWLQRLRGHPHHDDPTGPGFPREPQTEKRQPLKPDPKDPNVPQKRLQLHQKNLYERMLPGQAFVSAHCNRLQHGYYENNGALHEPALNSVYFVSCHFVFHPHRPRENRFKSADIKVSVHGDFNPDTDFDHGRYRPAKSSPRILKHAPELIYGAVSPEDLQWNFSLSSSLGVSQAPLTATLNPYGGVKSSYKIYDMMSIQGSLRSLKSPLGPEYDVDDAVAVWTLEENLLQRSGLPREFDFVLLVHKPDDVKNVYLTVDVDATVEAWFGEYPQWYTNLSRYLPTQDLTLDFNTDIGQRFVPSIPGRGFNFADLPHSLEEYVIMPGTVYPANDTTADRTTPRGRSGRTFDHHTPGPNRTNEQPFADGKAIEASPAPLDQPFTPTRRYTAPGQQPAPSRQSWAPDTLNVRVMLEHSYPHSPSTRRYSGSPLSHLDPVRHHSVRRKRSRSELKEYGAQQALHEIARETLKENEREEKSRHSRAHGSAKTAVSDGANGYI
ncbi:hypothetical protein K458DRAFT_423862 [Lentithecium fluviatile CBS 122367]|uniref:Uncharacterized protein n=1 Tax=Lentithecium fluviatile CBS 122367 TaxID=1168545 RepID=A0A6G1IHZ3_9PLEO|nr:hypothetical protein K458DRAFT_423862 [Lentithecium fluviatile CBS 122367]